MERSQLNQIFPPLKDESGKSIKCACGCGRVARHLHHMQYRSEGGSDAIDNLLPLCHKCHVAIHSNAGDYARWGAQGGKSTAQRLVSMSNLVQFRGPDGQKRYERWLEKRSYSAMGVMYSV